MQRFRTVLAGFVLLGSALGFPCGDPGTNAGSGVGLCFIKVDDPQTEFAPSDQQSVPVPPPAPSSQPHAR